MAVAVTDDVRRAPTRRLTPRSAAFWLLMAFAASVPLEDIGHLGPLGSAAKVAGIAAAAGGAYALFTDLPMRRVALTHFLFGLFVVWVVLSYFWTTDPSLTLNRGVTFVELLILAWLIWQETRSTQACESLMLAYVAGATAGCIESIATHHSIHGGVGRLSVGDPNSFGVSVVIAMVMAYHVIITTTSRWKRIACIGFLPISALGVFATASRTAIVALGLAGLIIVAESRSLRPRRLLVLGALALIAAVLVAHFVTSAQLQRISTVGSAASSGDLHGRTTQWKLSYDSFSKHPLLGVGAAAFRDQAAQAIGVARAYAGGQHAVGHVAHNSFLGVLADLGIPGLLLFLLVFISVFARLPSLPSPLRRTWFAIVAVWLVGAGTLTWENHKITWFLTFLLLAQIDASARERGLAGAAATVPAVG